jgi:hypothetical protein
LARGAANVHLKLEARTSLRAGQSCMAILRTNPFSNQDANPFSLQKRCLCSKRKAQIAPRLQRTPQRIVFAVRLARRAEAAIERPRRTNQGVQPDVLKRPTGSETFKVRWIQADPLQQVARATRTHWPHRPAWPRHRRSNRPRRSAPCARSRAPGSVDCGAARDEVESSGPPDRRHDRARRP